MRAVEEVESRPADGPGQDSAGALKNIDEILLIRSLYLSSYGIFEIFALTLNVDLYLKLLFFLLKCSLFGIALETSRFYKGL